MYAPDPVDPLWDFIYGGDNGPLLNIEMDFFLYRIPYVGPIGLAISAGWARYQGQACDAATITPTGCMQVSQKATFNLFPVAIMALLRVDVLAERTPVPLVFVGKIGFDSIFFTEKIAPGKESGRSHGLRWGAQFNLELNSISPKRANALDDDWGINSSYLFFELIGSDANSKSNIADKLAWTAGLGLTL